MRGRDRDMPFAVDISMDRIMTLVRKGLLERQAAADGPASVL
jgi:hypothetical protein